MAEFKVLVDDKEYTLEYVRDSVRQFEAMGGSMRDMQSKIYTTVDILFYCGLRKHHKEIGVNLSKKISDRAIEEYGIDEVYPILMDKFSEVYIGEENKDSKKSFLVSEIMKARK